MSGAVGIEPPGYHPPDHLGSAYNVTTAVLSGFFTEKHHRLRRSYIMARTPSVKALTKKLDKDIEQFYYRHAAGKMISIMDIGKVYAEGRKAYVATQSMEAVETAIIGAVAKYCMAVN
jgi:hypothetical protein